MRPQCFHKPIDISRQQLPCVSPLPSTVSIYSSTHPSIIPSINHETDGLSGVLVRTDGFPLPRPYHCPPPFPPHFHQPTPPKYPHITHIQRHLHHMDSHGTTINLSWKKDRSSAYQLLIHTHKNPHEMVAKRKYVSSKSVYL